MNKEERIIAIYEELSTNEVKEARNQTLKTYVYKILQELKTEKFNQQITNEQNDFNISWSLGLLAITALILIFIGSDDNNDINWFQENMFAIKIWGIALASLYIGISIEKISIIRNLWQFGFTKLIVSLTVSGLVVFSTGKAAGEINSVFGVDASAFPFTLTFTSALVFFHYILPILLSIGIVAIIFALDAIGWIRSEISDSHTYKLPPVHSFIFPIIATILLAIFWGWSKNDFSDEKLPSNIYKLAHILDFNSKHECENIKDKVPLVFLGSAETTVLLDLNKINVEDLRSFFEKDIKVPSSFYRLECTMPNYVKNTDGQ